MRKSAWVWLESFWDKQNKPLLIELCPFSTPNMSNPHPSLAKLSCELDSLSKAEVRYLCMLLGVPDATLNNIESNPLNNDPLTCIAKYLSALIDRDVPLTWEGIADVLCSKRLDKSGLAGKIRKKYGITIAAVQEEPTTRSPQVLSTPLSPRSSDSDSVSSTSDIDTSDASSSLSKQPLPTPPQSSDDSLPPRKKSKFQPLTSDPARDRLAKKVNSFKKRFRGIVVSTNVYLSKRLCQSGFERFKVDLTTLPMLGKTHHFLQSEKAEIKKAKSVEDVFDILDPYWNHIDYALLEHIIEKYCGKRLKKEMKRYKCKLHRFEKVTSVKKFTKASASLPTPPRGHKSVTVTLDVDGEECSLYRVRQMKEAITQHAALEPYVTLLHGLHASRVVLELAFPRLIFPHVKRALNKLFVLENGDVLQHLKFNERWFILALNLSHTMDRYYTMNEITYTIRKRDLKEDVGCAGPKEFEKKCEVIAFNQEVNIVTCWKSSKVEIDVYGLNFKVFTAIKCISEAFLNSESETSEVDKAMECDVEEDAKMPDPPQNVTEELCHVINHHNLKEEFRESGPPILQDLCNRIESQTQVSIQFQRTPDGLEFQISGHEEGVVTALQNVKQEFEIQSSTSEDKEWEGTQLTEEALQQHNKRMEKQVRQFECYNCDRYWWRVVPSHKPVSRCKRCRERYDPIPRDEEYGMGLYTCVNPECRHVFYSEHYYFTEAKVCPKCLQPPEGPLFHPSNEFRSTKCRLFYYVIHERYHRSTGSTNETYLSQGDLFKPVFSTNPTNKRCSSHSDLRHYEKTECPNEKTECPYTSRSQSVDRQPIYYYVQQSSNHPHHFRRRWRQSLDLELKDPEQTSPPLQHHSSQWSPLATPEHAHSPPLHHSSSQWSLAIRGSTGSRGSGHSSVGSACLMR